MHERLEKWCFEELNKLLGSPSEEIVRYILDIQNPEELKEFLEDLFGHLSEDVQEKFMNDLLTLKKEIPNQLIFTDTISGVHLNNEPTVYRKPPEEDFSSLGHSPTGPNTSSGKNKHKRKKNKAQAESSVTNGNSHVMLDPLLAVPNEKSPNEKSPSGQKQRRSGQFVPLYDSSHIVLLPGRHPCLCQASKHALINNCIQCGRIVCIQEGSGPCFTCSALVCTPEEQDVLRRGSKKSEKLLNQLTTPPDQELLRRAVEHKNKLLEYNITAAQRTKVIDDESDYFALSSNKWISEEERKAFKKKAEEDHNQKHARRFGNKFTLNLDFAGRAVSMNNEPPKAAPKVMNIQTGISEIQLGCETSPVVPEFENDNDQDIHPLIAVLPPVYQPTDMELQMSGERVEDFLPRHGQQIRLQDRELQELSDQGFCLSMHQPWASLLIRGIKIHEGRTWYTTYRGPLWIHSGSKPPSKQDISDTEGIYQTIYQKKDIDFPKQYPTSCLLGCILLVDCLQQEEYRRQYPDGESASPYVFICENPQELIVKIPMAGKHKIFKMDQNLHKAVKKALRKLNESKFV